MEMDRYVIRRFLSFTNRIQAAAENQKVLINALLFCCCQPGASFEQSGDLHTLFLPFWNKYKITHPEGLREVLKDSLR